MGRTPEGDLCCLNDNGLHAADLELALRSAAFHDPGGFWIPDLAEDERFRNHPVLHRLGIRFAAAVPITSCGGERLGTLAVYDVKPRKSSAKQKKNLAELAKLISSQMRLLPMTGLDSGRADIALQSSDAVFSQDLTGNILSANESLALASGYSCSTLMDMTSARLLSAESVARFQDAAVSLLGGESSRSLSLNFVHKFGVQTSWIVDMRLLLRPGNESRILCIARNDASRIHTANGLQEILEAITPVTGDAFFRSLAANLSVFLGIKYAFVAELHSGPPRLVRTLAISQNGTLLENSDHWVEGTPCEQVLDHGFQWYPSSTQKIFDTVSSLKEMAVESYIGTPLRSSKGKVIGLLAIMDVKQWTPDPRVEAALNLFALRAAVELERRATEGKKELLSNLVENSSELVVMLSLSGDVLYWNKALGTICGIGNPDHELVRAQLRNQLATFCASLQAGIETLRATGHFESCLVLTDAVSGQQIPCEFNAVLLKSTDAGEPASIAAFGRDLRSHMAASQALLEADQKYLATISTASEGIVLRRADATISACNSSARQIFGIPDDQTANQICYDRWQWFREDGSEIAPEEHPTAVALRTGTAQSVATIGVTRFDGASIWLSLKAMPIVMPGCAEPYGVISSFTDITLERGFKLGLKELHRLSNANHDSVADLFHDFIRTGCQMFDMPHGYLSQANGETMDVPYIVSSLADLLPGMSVPYKDSFCRFIIEDAITVAVEDTLTETKYLSPPIFHQLGVRSYFGTAIMLSENVFGVLGFFSLSPKPAGFFNSQRRELLELMSRSLGRVVHDEQTRNSRLKAEDDLRRSESLFRSIIENTSDFVCILDAHRQMKYVSPSIARALNTGSGSAAALSIPDVLSGNQMKVLVRQERIWLSHPGPHPTFELTVKSTGNKLIHLECTATNLLADPVVAGIVLSGRDVTERKLAHQLDLDRNRILEMIAHSEPAHDAFREITAMVEHQQPGLKAAILLLRRGQLFWECAPKFPVDALAAFPRISVNPDNGCYARAAHSRQSQTATDIMFDAFWRPRRRIATELLASQCLASPVVSAFGQVLGVFALHFEEGMEITERHLALVQAAVSMTAISMEHNLLNDQLSYQSQHDALTGLPNRLQLQDRLPNALEEAGNQGKLLAVCFIDLDRFKQINDTLGHTIGDHLLEQVSRRLKYCVRKGGLVARMGGDEFAVVLAGLTSEDEALQQSEELLASLRSPFQVDGHELFVTACMGIGMFPRDGRDVATLLRNADSAMYIAKHKGNDSLEFFKPGLGATALRNLEMETYLRRAIDNNELRILYQPQVDLDGRVESVEALVKWHHPKLGRISPGQFIPIAEESGMIVPIGAWVLRQACLQNAAWQAAGLRPIRVSVNVSAVQFARPDFVGTVAAALEESGLSPRYLDLELTESILVRDLQESAALMSVLRDVGVSISIDDFGTGYSSLSYLRRLPADTLKIDQSFLRESTVDTGSLAVIQTIVSLAHNLGLTVVAEGVETAAHLDIIRIAGCDKAQGHFFGEAITPDEVPPLLLESRIR